MAMFRPRWSSLMLSSLSTSSPVRVLHASPLRQNTMTGTVQGHSKCDRAAAKRLSGSDSRVAANGASAAPLGDVDRLEAVPACTQTETKAGSH